MSFHQVFPYNKALIGSSALLQQCCAHETCLAFQRLPKDGFAKPKYLAGLVTNAVPIVMLVSFPLEVVLGNV